MPVPWYVEIVRNVVIRGSISGGLAGYGVGPEIGVGCWETRRAKPALRNFTLLLIRQFRREDSGTSVVTMTSQPSMLTGG